MIAVIARLHARAFTDVVRGATRALRKRVQGDQTAVRFCETRRAPAPTAAAALRRRSSEPSHSILGTRTFRRRRIPTAACK